METKAGEGVKGSLTGGKEHLDSRFRGNDIHFSPNPPIFHDVSTLFITCPHVYN
jgi:hypothetical protein